MNSIDTLQSAIRELRLVADYEKSLSGLGTVLADVRAANDELTARNVELAEKSDAEMLRVKACEYIAEGELDWERLRNECPSTGAVSKLRDDYEKLLAELARLKEQLPEGMKHCTILCNHCEKGHAWLTARNWIQYGCPTCELDGVLAELTRLKEPRSGECGDGRMTCRNCGNRVYLDSTWPSFPMWRHHASNFTECFAGLDTKAEPAPAAAPTKSLEERVKSAVMEIVGDANDPQREIRCREIVMRHLAGYVPATAPVMDDRERYASLCDKFAAECPYDAPYSRLTCEQIAAAIRSLPPLAECPKCADLERQLAEARKTPDAVPGHWTDPPAPEVKPAPEPPINWSVEPAGPRMDAAVTKVVSGACLPYSLSWIPALAATRQLDIPDAEILRQPGETIALRACRAILLKHEGK